MKKLFKLGKTQAVFVVLILLTVLAAFKIYPTNYEQLFTPINSAIDFIIYGSLLTAVACLFSKSKISGTKSVSDISFVCLITTLGLGGAFFSYCVDPSFLTKYEYGHPAEILSHWYGPSQWALFVPFLLIEICDAKGKFPKWLSEAKNFAYAISMFVALGITLLSGCRTIPRLLDAMFQIEISPYAIITPIAALSAISLIRGIHKGMRVFALVTMALCGVVTVVFISTSNIPGLLEYTSEHLLGTYSHFFEWNNYTGTVFENEQYYPFMCWMFTWIGIMSPFIKKISEGRSLRSSVLLSVLGPSFVCTFYALISTYSFSTHGSAMEWFGNESWLGIIYIIMILMMFITTEDSSCYNLDQLVSKNDKMPVVGRKLLWIFATCTFITIMMLLGGGTIDALYGISYLTGPVILILGFICIGYLIYDFVKVRLVKIK